MRCAGCVQRACVWHVFTPTLGRLLHPPQRCTNRVVYPGTNRVRICTDDKRGKKERRQEVTGPPSRSGNIHTPYARRTQEARLLLQLPDGRLTCATGARSRLSHLFIWAPSSMAGGGRVRAGTPPRRWWDATWLRSCRARLVYSTRVRDPAGGRAGGRPVTRTPCHISCVSHTHTCGRLH